MNNIKLIKAENGKGWFLDVENVIPMAPLTAEELWAIHKMIEDTMQEIWEEIVVDLPKEDI